MTDLRQAAQQALEALELHAKQYPHMVKGYTADAASVLRERLEQQAEAVAWDKPGASFNDWWDGDYDDAANPFKKDSAAYWAWAGWKAGQRQWVGLTDEDVNRESAHIAQQMKLAFHAGMYVAQKILKEKNND